MANPVNRISSTCPRNIIENKNSSRSRISVRIFVGWVVRRWGFGKSGNTGMFPSRKTWGFHVNLAHLEFQAIANSISSTLHIRRYKDKAKFLWSRALLTCHSIYLKRQHTKRILVAAWPPWLAFRASVRRFPRFWGLSGGTQYLGLIRCRVYSGEPIVQRTTIINPECIENHRP